MAEVQLKDIDGKDIGSFTPSCLKKLTRSAEEQGVPIPISCEAGKCKICVCTVISGGRIA